MRGKDTPCTLHSAALEKKSRNFWRLHRGNVVKPQRLGRCIGPNLKDMVCILHSASLEAKIDASLIGAVPVDVMRIQSSEGPSQRLAPVVCQLGQHLQCTQDAAHLAGRPSAHADAQAP
jgi:hypothetical protein